MPQISVAEISVDVIHKEIKNLHLGVYPPDGRVRVAAPFSVNDEAVRLAVIARLPWIRKQRESFQNQMRESPRTYTSQERHSFLGREYLLTITETTGKQGVSITEAGDMILSVRPGADTKRREKVLSDWHKKELKKLISPLIAKWEPVLGVRVTAFGIRKMKTKWGSCNPKTARIVINTELIKKPVHCLDYIVLHEMVHLIEKRHNDRFRSVLTRHMPDWQDIRSELNNTPIPEFL